MEYIVLCKYFLFARKGVRQGYCLIQIVCMLGLKGSVLFGGGGEGNRKSIFFNQNSPLEGIYLFLNMAPKMLYIFTKIVTERLILDRIVLLSDKMSSKNIFYKLLVLQRVRFHDILPSIHAIFL